MPPVNYDSPTPNSWSTYMNDIYASRRPPTLGTFDIDRIEQLAREKLKDSPNAFHYVFGSAGTSSGYRGNLEELNKWRIIPRMLRDATARDLNTTLFGVTYKSPLIVAPVGVQGIVHADAENATAKAARNVGVPFVMSTASTRTIEEVAEASGDGHRWYQLYWPTDRNVIVSLLKRAKASGFTALVVTLDTMLLGWRPHDLDTAYLPFIHGYGAQVGLSDPVFMAKYGLEPVTNQTPKFPYNPSEYDKLLLQGDEQQKQKTFISLEWMKQTNSGTFKSWEDLKFVRENWDGPLILKGILSVQDAELAIDAGVDGIIVSNHGGRQVDAVVPAIWALEKICSSPKIKEAQASGQLAVLFDSGLRTGSDIIKAVALGAQAVLLGRPFMYGLTVGGQEGVEQVLKSTLADLEVTLGLCGYKSIRDIHHKGGEVVVKMS